MDFKKYRKQIVIVMDTLIILFVCVGVFIFTSVEKVTFYKSASVWQYISVLAISVILSNIILRTYDSLWRYAESKEYLTLLIGAVSGCICFIFINKLIIKNEIPIFVAITICSISLVLMLLMRFTYRIIRARSSRKKIKDGIEDKIPLIIIGAGSVGVRLLEEIQGDNKNKYKTMFFIDDSVEKIGRVIYGIEVKGPSNNLPKLLEAHPNSEIIVAIPSLSAEKRKTILNVCASLRHKVKVITGALEMMDNIFQNVRDIKIEDLLGREPVKFNNIEVKKFIANKTVLVTGGGGSIGSELCRQIAGYSPKKLIIIDIYENNAYEIQQELLYTYNSNLNLCIEIANVRDDEKMDILFEKYRPDIILHAAAHKHVPFMEDCPEEAVKNNIFGTYNLVRAADKWNAEKFVLISSDKAVNPTNIMGASKRFCEMIIQSMRDISSTEFVAVRFGNVLGSNGSVIPLFLSQIEHGGPVTITDMRIIRYFMTIREAAQLVLQAGAMAGRSDIFVLDMGQPVKIIELAENLIKLSGFIPYVEIPIIEIGLRKGEKLYEELLINNCNRLIVTRNSKIYIDEHEEVLPLDMEYKYKALLELIETRNFSDIKSAMKTLVPTYKEADEVNALVGELDTSENAYALTQEEAITAEEKILGVIH